MNRRIKLAALALVAVGAAVWAFAWQPAIEGLREAPQARGNPALLAQGARVAALGDCMACHSAPAGKPYAGGLPLSTPFGTLYSTNITPDLETGIGGWSLEAFTRAMRRGVARDGRLLYPAFPYSHFTRMTDEDIGSLYIYLMAREAVHAPARANQLRFPFNFRPLIAGWNLLFLTPGPLPAPPEPTAEEWLRGRYLVEGPAHCAACHTPMNVLGAEKSSRPFAGSLVDGWQAPPLNALASARQAWTLEQMVSYLRTGLASDHGAAAGPMLPVTQHLAEVPETDVRAIASYIMDMQSATDARRPAYAYSSMPVDAATPSDAQPVDAGAALFGGACAACHGADAPMHAIGGRPALGLGTSIQADDPRNAIRMVLGGIPWEGSASAHFMPPFADTLSDEQIAEVLRYVRAHATHRPAWSQLKNDVATIRKEISQ